MLLGKVKVGECSVTLLDAGNSGAARRLQIDNDRHLHFPARTSYRFRSFLETFSVSST